MQRNFSNLSERDRKRRGDRDRQSSNINTTMWIQCVVLMLLYRLYTTTVSLLHRPVSLKISMLRPARL